MTLLHEKQKLYTFIQLMAVNCFSLKTQIYWNHLSKNNLPKLICNKLRWIALCDHIFMLCVSWKWINFIVHESMYISLPTGSYIYARLQRNFMIPIFSGTCIWAVDFNFIWRKFIISREYLGFESTQINTSGSWYNIISSSNHTNFKFKYYSLTGNSNVCYKMWIELLTSIEYIE